MSDNSIYNENELLLKIAEGDEKAFRQLYQLYNARLYSFLLRLTAGSADMASDILQETFLQLWLYRDALHGIDNPRAYINRMAANRAQLWMRKNLNHAELDQTLSSASSDSLELLSSKTLANHIASIVANMPEQRREIYKLHREKGLTSAQIADQLQLSSSTVRNTVAAALKDIRKKLSDMGYRLSALFFF